MGMLMTLSKLIDSTTRSNLLYDVHNPLCEHRKSSNDYKLWRCYNPICIKKSSGVGYVNPKRDTEHGPTWYICGNCEQEQGVFEVPKNSNTSRERLRRASRRRWSRNADKIEHYIEHRQRTQVKQMLGLYK